MPFEEIAGYPYGETADYSYVGQIHREGYAQRPDYRDYRSGRTYGPPAGERMPHATGQQYGIRPFYSGEVGYPTYTVDMQTPIN